MIAEEIYLGSLASVSANAPAEDHILLATVSRLLDESRSIHRFRAARGQEQSAQQQDIWRQLCSLGLIGACAPARAGGSGLPPSTGVMIAEVFGQCLAPEPYVAGAFLPVMLLGKFDNEISDALLRSSFEGKTLPVLAFQEFASAAQMPAQQTRLTRQEAGFALNGSKRFVQGAAWATHFIVSAECNGDPCFVLMPRDAVGLAINNRPQADGTFAAELTFDNMPIQHSALISRGPACTDAMDAVMDWAHIAVSAELFGLSSALFGMTIGYLRTRTQFDQPIGAFQALQHRCADLYCAKEIARFTIASAAASLQTVDGDERAALASRCKARAAQTATRIAYEAVQLHGAIGFSDEADVGLYLNRILVLCAWLGGADHHRRRYARLKPYRMH